MKTLVDTNVLIDVITRDRSWGAWAENALREAAERSTLAINPIIFAEVSTKFARIEDTDAALADFAREPLPYEAGLPGRQGISRLPAAWWCQAVADAGLLRRRPRGDWPNEFAHPGRCPVPNLLSRADDCRTVGGPAITVGGPSYAR